MTDYGVLPVDNMMLVWAIGRWCTSLSTLMYCDIALRRRSGR